MTCGALYGVMGLYHLGKIIFSYCHKRHKPMTLVRNTKPHHNENWKFYRWRKLQIWPYTHLLRVSLHLCKTATPYLMGKILMSKFYFIFWFFFSFTLGTFVSITLSLTIYMVKLLKSLKWWNWCPRKNGAFNGQSYRPCPGPALLSPINTKMTFVERG